MKKSYLNIAALAAAVTMTLCSCSSGKNSVQTISDTGNSPNPAGDAVTEPHAVQTADEVLSDSFKATAVSIPENIDWIYAAVHVKDKNRIYVSGGGYKNDKSFNYVYSYSDDLSSYELIDTPAPDECAGVDEYSCFHNIAPDGTISCLYVLHNFPIKEPETYDENFDYEAFYAAMETSFVYRRYSPDGTVEETVALTDTDSYLDEYDNFSVSSIVEYKGRTLMCLDDSTIVELQDDGSFTPVYTPETDDDDDISDQLYFSTLNYDPDGKMVLLTRNHRDITSFCDFDPETGAVSEPFIKVGEEEAEQGYVVNIAGQITTGYGDDRFMIPMYDALYTVRPDNTLEKKLDWLDSDITASTVFCIGEDKYLTFCHENNNDVSFNLLTRRPMSEVENVKVITMATIYGVWGGDTHISKFNKSQDKYRVQYIDYNQYNSETDYHAEGAIRQLKLDIAAGKAPDIISLENYNDMVDLSKINAFADLYEYMDKDNEINRNTLMPNVISALESDDGNLYMITPSFGVTTLAAKTSVYNKENWTLAEMIDLYDNAPASADHLYDYDTKTDMFDMFLQASTDFVDYKKASCRFDSQDFIDLLEFCNRFVPEISKPDKETEPEALQTYYYDKFMAWSGNRSLVEPMSPCGQTGYSYTRYVRARDEITLVGYPSDNGKGGKLTFGSLFAISNTCPEKEGAWEFIQSYLCEDYQDPSDDYNNYNGCPVLRSSFEKVMDSTMHLTRFGEPVESIEDDGAEYYPLTQEQRDMVSAYIKNCDTVYGVMDADVYDICVEEAGAYFAGECSAKQAADMIQSRASILLSERS